MPKLPETEGYYVRTQVIERTRPRRVRPGRGDRRQEDIVLAQVTRKIEKAAVSSEISRLHYGRGD